MKRHFILFYATYCGKCHTLKKRIQRLKDKDQVDFDIEWIDVDRSKDLADRYHVDGVPTLIVIEDGEEIRRLTGSIYKEELIELAQ